MARIRLEPGERIVEEEVALHGTVPRFVFKAVIPLFTALTIALVCRVALPAYHRMVGNKTTGEIPVFRVMSHLFLPIMGGLVLALVYYIVHLYVEKIVLTNKAILRRGVFTVKRIAFADIVTVAGESEQFNTINEDRQRSYLAGALLGINQAIRIEAASGRRMVIKHMTRRHADELEKKLAAARVGAGERNGNSPR